MRVQFLEASDLLWTDALGGLPHDFYSLPGYVSLAARIEGGSPTGVLVEDDGRRLLLPLLLRPVPSGVAGPGTDDRCDAVSPYGYAGINLGTVNPARPADADFLDAAMAAVVEALREQGIVSLFIRLNPLLATDATIMARHGIVVDHGHTVSIDLLADEADLFREIRRSHAKDLRRLDRRGYTCELDSACRPESIDAFVQVYTETMDRLGASASYYFDAAYVNDLIAALDGRVMIATIWSSATNEIAAAGLYTEVGGIVQAHLGGTRTAFIRAAPSKLETREAALWARSRGNRLLHLGGGVGGAADALFDFKAGFSPGRHPFQTVRIVIDPPAYDELLANWSAAAGQPALDPAGFFPPYRARIPVAAG